LNSEWTGIDVGVHTILTVLPKHVVSREERRLAMKFEMTNFQAVAASLAVEGEVCDLPQTKLWMQAETDAEMAPLIQKLGATSIAEIDRLIAELQDAKGHLQSERERIERETVRYTALTQIASTTAKIISDAVSQWHPARNRQKSKTFEVTAASTEDDIIGVRKSEQARGAPDSLDA
jgi:hypothetical protein